MFPPLMPMAMAISSRQTPGSRMECFERNDKTLWLPTMPSVIERRQSSLNLISALSIQTACPRFFRSDLIRSTSSSFASWP